MKKRKTQIIVCILIMLGVMVFPSITKADLWLSPPDFDSETLIKTEHISDKTIYLTSNYEDLMKGEVKRLYFQSSTCERTCISVLLDDVVLRDDCIFELYGKSLYVADLSLPYDKLVLEGEEWKTYYVSVPSEKDTAVESFVYEDSRCIGYKTSTGKTYPLPSPDEVKQLINPTPSPTPTSPAPSKSPMPTPTQLAAPTPSASASPTVTAEPEPTATAKPMYTLKKGTLTWKAGNKTGKAKNVTEVAYTKSDKLIFRDKKGRAYTVSQNGKKKLIVKKRTKKFIYVGTGKNKYVSKVKTKSGFIKVK